MEGWRGCHRKRAGGAVRLFQFPAQQWSWSTEDADWKNALETEIPALRAKMILADRQLPAQALEAGEGESYIIKAMIRKM